MNFLIFLFRASSSLQKFFSWSALVAAGFMIPTAPLPATAQTDCQQAAAAERAVFEAARAAHAACRDGERKRLAGYLLKGRTAANACSSVGIGFDACESTAEAQCDALARRDRKVAECRALKSLRQMAEMARGTEGEPAADIAADMVRALNMARRPATPGTALSRLITSGAITTLGEVSDGAFAAFSKAAREFDAADTAMGARQLVGSMSLVPRRANTELALALTEMQMRTARMEGLADRVAGESYALPGGDEFTAGDRDAARDLTDILLDDLFAEEGWAPRLAPVTLDMNRAFQDTLDGRRNQPQPAPKLAAPDPARNAAGGPNSSEGSGERRMFGNFIGCREAKALQKRAREAGRPLPTQRSMLTFIPDTQWCGCASGFQQWEILCNAPAVQFCLAKSYAQKAATICRNAYSR